MDEEEEAARSPYWHVSLGFQEDCDLATLEVHRLTFDCSV